MTVTLPSFKHPRDGTMRTAIMLPPELSNAISVSVADAYDTLGHPIPEPGKMRGETWLASR